MAVYKLFPSKDATITTVKTESNAGLDSILEVSSYKRDDVTSVTIINREPWDLLTYTWSGSSPTANFYWNEPPTSSEETNLAINRSLVQFDQNEIKNVFNSYIGDKSWDTTLNTFVATAQGLDEQTELEVWPIAYEWENGSGQTGDSPENKDGVSWRHRIKRGLSNLSWPTSSVGLPPYVNVEIPAGINGGGAWYTGSSDPGLTLPKTVSFNVRTFKDLSVNVTDIVDTWNKTHNNINPYTSILNNGFLIKLAERTEVNSSNDIQPILKYYSVDTNTIYPPTLDIKWEDFNRETTLPDIDSQDVFIGLDNNPGEFHYSAINKFRLNVRPEFPTRTYQTASLYTTNHVLPEDSYYAIKDLDTNEYVVDFDEKYTKISADNTSNFFNVYMNGLEPERYYKILIKTQINGETVVKDNKYYFKVING